MQYLSRKRTLLKFLNILGIQVKEYSCYCLLRGCLSAVCQTKSFPEWACCFALEFALSLCGLFTDARKVVPRTKTNIKVTKSSWGTIMLRIYFVKNFLKGTQEKMQPSQEIATSRHFTVDTSHQEYAKEGAPSQRHSTCSCHRHKQPLNESAATFLTEAYLHSCAGVAHWMLPQSRGDAKPRCPPQPPSTWFLVIHPSEMLSWG